MADNLVRAIDRGPPFLSTTGLFECLNDMVSDFLQNERSKRLSRNCSGSYDLASEVACHHFYHILLAHRSALIHYGK